MKKILFLFASIIFALSMNLDAQVTTNELKVPDSVNRTDPNGNKVGFWIEKMGEITSKGEYVANKKVKNWIGYYPGNMISKIEYFNNGLRDGISIQFDKKGKISLVENYKNGLVHGQSIFYNSMTESPLSETEYAFGKRNGLYRQYYDNGKIQEESMFANDLKNGISRWNNKNGQRIAEFNYKAGNFEGVQKTFYETDTLQSVENYVNNLLSGEAKEFYPGGNVKVSGKYLDGLKDGAWTNYNEMGKVEKVIKYKGGVELNKK